MQQHDQTLMLLTTTLTHVARTYKARADTVSADFGLSQATAWPIVMISRLGDGVRPGMLAEALGLEPPSLVRVIEQLVVSHLIERREDTSDRRAKTLHLTARGRECALGVEKALIPFRRSLFDDVDQADIDACIRVLTRLDQVMAGASGYLASVALGVHNPALSSSSGQELE
jgi:MarR family transcriptional regulator for hemolysin